MDQQHEASIFSLDVSPIMRRDLSETVKWGKFLAILGFIAVGLIVLGGIFLAMSNGSGDSFGAFSGIGGAFVYLIIAAAYFYPAYALYKFCISSKLALQSNNQSLFEEAFRYLKNMFKYMGVLAIIILCLYALIIGVAVMGRL